MQRRARDELILSWLPLVRHLASAEFARLGSLPRLLVIDVEDLAQSGAVGLILAVDRFDPGLAAPETYFPRRIRGAIFDFLRSFPYVHWDGKVTVRAELEELETVPSGTSELSEVEWRLDFERLAEGLGERERDVVSELVAGTPQNEIARRLGVTAGRVSQIKNAAARNLRGAVRWDPSPPADQ